MKVHVKFMWVPPQPYSIDLFTFISLKLHPICIILGECVAFESDLPNATLVLPHFIAHPRQGVKLHVDFGLHAFLRLA